MKRFILAAILVLCISCGQASGKPTAAVVSPSPSPAASASAAPSALSSPSSKSSPIPTPKTSPTLLFAVLEAKGTANAWTYNTVAIAGVDGYARAKTTFVPITSPIIGCFGTVTPQSARVAAGKVYFADNKGVIRSLAIDGTVSVAATFPLTSTQQMLSFAISPDGTKLLGTIFTLPANISACNGAWSGTFNFDAYSATSGGSSQLVYHDSWTTSRNVLALTGWDSIGPIGTYPTVWASQGGGPGSTLGVEVRVDATTMRPGAPLTDPTKCQVWHSVASGAFVCLGDAVMTAGGTANQRVTQPVSVRQAGDIEVWHATVVGNNSPFGPFLSPDGQRVVICCNDLDLANSHELVIGNSTQPINIAKGFYAAGWLDSTTVVGAQDGGQMAYVALSSPGVAVSMAFAGLFLGTVRA
jgi:hypothetical protein